MKVYAGMDPRMPLREVGPYAQRIEAMGYDGLHVAETVHDAFGASLLAAEHTAHIVVRTSVALAFVRSPLLTAYAAWDLARFSNGRFELGLGTQIRQNIEDRYGMPWADPVSRMRDYLQALASIYRTFRTGERLHHDGPHYRLTRMQPHFNAGPDDTTTPPPTWLGGVNAGICQVAGELAAGLVTHPTNSNVRYLETICHPNLRAGAERAGRDPADVDVVIGTPVITGADDAELDAERERQRHQIAFLYSTPAYRRTLELYGWEDLAGELQAMIRVDDWDALHKVVTDEVLSTLVPTARYDELAPLLLSRFGHLGTGLLFTPPSDPHHDDAAAEVVARLQAGCP
jgi:probable F420-dependent oxidoreductase